MSVLFRVQRFDRWNWGEGALREEKSSSRIRAAGLGKSGSSGAGGSVQLSGVFACGGALLGGLGVRRECSLTC